MEFSSSEVLGYISCSWDDKTLSSTAPLPPRLPEIAKKGWYRKLFDMISEKCLQKNPTATDWIVLMIFLEWHCFQSFSCYFYLLVFSEFVFPHPLQLSWIFLTTNSTCNFWSSKSQHVSTHTFCSRDDPFMQIWNCGSPNILCKCTQSLSTLSTNV